VEEDFFKKLPEIRNLNVVLSRDELKNFLSDNSDWLNHYG
jgi:hypothetical protein